MGLFSKKKPVVADTIQSEDNAESNLKYVNFTQKQPGTASIAQPMPDLNDEINQPEVQPSHTVGVMEEFDPQHATHFLPDSYNDTKQIADTLIRFKNVTVSFANIQGDDKKRVIDFLLGVMYGLDGDYKKIDKGIYYFWIQ